MSGSLSPRTPGLLALAAAGLIAALASGRPELALLTAPFLVFAGAGLVLAQEPQLAAEIELDRTRLLEGEEVVATVRLRNDGTDAVLVELAPVRSRYLALDPAGVVAMHLPAGAEAQDRLRRAPAALGSALGRPGGRPRTRSARRHDLGGAARPTGGSAGVPA